MRIDQAACSSATVPCPTVGANAGDGRWLEGMFDYCFTA